MDTITHHRDSHQGFWNLQGSLLNKHILLWVLFAFTTIVIYRLPKEVDFLFIVTVFIFFARSRQNYFWLAYFILLSYAPFGLFTEGTRDAAYRLPLFSLGPGLSFSTLQIFLFIGFVKALMVQHEVRSYFVAHYKVLLIYVGFLALVAILVHDTSLGNFISGLKLAFNLSFFFIIYKLIYEREEKYKFISLLIPFGFLILLDAFYFLITSGDYIYNFFNPIEPRETGGLGLEASAVNIRFEVRGFILSYLIFIFSLSYYFISKNKYYFLLAALSAFIVILVGSLRSWFVVYTLALIFFMFYSSERIKHIIVIGVLVLGLLIPVLNSSSGSAALSGAFTRIGTVFSLGKESSAATQQIEGKITKRLPSQLQYIRENPLTGWAFTEKESDGDVGNIGLIVEGGFVGFIIFIWFWLTYINILRKHIKILKSPHARKVLKMLIVMFLGTLLSHFTTNRMFGFFGGYFIGILVFFTEFILDEVKLNEQLHELETDATQVQTSDVGHTG